MFDAFKFYVRETPYGVMQIHGYPYDANGSTFIVEMNDQVWQRAGFDAKATLGEWVWPGYVPESEPRARKLYGRLAKLRPTRRFGVANLFAEGVKP